ncbi:CBS domain-containing protein [Streptomyces sp. NPDC052396]|uniref:CBS domain-containing protein n=1 Tax=Streptomyces sp. NPDC052396 TaxID=3365689 RepID=UPI0037D86B5A
MEIRYAMSSPPASVGPEASVEEAARHMADAGVGALPVVQDDAVVGVVTDRDLAVRVLARGLSPQLKVESVMSMDPVTVAADTPVTAALYAMRSIGARHLPVLEEGRLVGMVSFDDLFSYLSRQLGTLADVVDAVRKVPDPETGGSCSAG